MKRLILSLAIVILLPGCTFGVVTKSRPTNIQLGMTKAEVIAIMGKPQEMSANDNEEVLRYSVANNKAMPIAAGWRDYTFRFEGGKLKSYGTTEAKK